MSLERARRPARAARRDRLREPRARARRRRRGGDRGASWPAGRGRPASRRTCSSGPPGRPSVLVRARGTRRRADAAAVRPPRHGRRRGHDRAAHAAHRGRAAVRPRRLRHEGGRRRRAAGRAARRRACGLRGDVVVAAVADEEHASLGVQEALEAVHADAAIVTEPTELELVVAHKGFVWAEVEVRGRAAHGSRPHLGVDAIVQDRPDPDRAGRARRARSARARTRCSGAAPSTPRSSRAAASARATPRAACSGSSAARCRARRRRTSSGSSRRCSTAAAPAIPRSRPSSGRCSCASRSRSTRDAELVGIVRAAAAEVLPAAAADRRRELLGRRGAHRRRRDPDRDVRAGRRGSARRRGVGQPAGHRGRRAHAGRVAARVCA